MLLFLATLGVDLEQQIHHALLYLFSSSFSVSPVVSVLSG